MEEQLKKALHGQKVAYLIFWLVPLLLVVCGEVCSDSLVGAWSSDGQQVYMAETVLILLTAACVPFALKSFAWLLARKIDLLSIEAAVRMYVRCGLLRLGLLAAPVWLGLLAYYVMLSTTGLLCALIALTASLFCVPGESRMRRDLHIDRVEEPEDKEEKTV